MKSSLKVALVSSFALLAGLSAAQAADEVGVGAGNLLVHVRGLGVFPDVQGHDTGFAKGASVIPSGGNIAIGKSYIPEVDASYFVKDWLALELIAGTTQHDVSDKNSVIGTANLGHVWLLPPTLTAQIHPFGRSKIDPYLGAGLNYTIFYDATGANNSVVGATTVKYKDNFGYAFEAGVNYEVAGPWFANIDVKKLLLSTTASVTTSSGYATSSRVNIDPWIVGVGVGYRF